MEIFIGGSFDPLGRSSLPTFWGLPQLSGPPAPGPMLEPCPPNVRPCPLLPTSLGRTQYLPLQQLLLSVEQSAPSCPPRCSIFPCLPPVDPWVGIGWGNAAHVLNPRSVQSRPPLIDLPQPSRPRVLTKQKTSGGISMCLCLLSVTSPSRCSRLAEGRYHCVVDAACEILLLHNECLPVDLDDWITGCHVEQLSQVSKRFDPELHFLS